jgi:hypothetical protein
MNRLTRLAGATVIATGALTAISPMAGPAVAANHCNQARWDVHPDLISTGGFSFGEGTHMRTGGYTDCPSNGQGYPGHSIDVHCRTLNDNGLWWVYVRDTTTGKAGWSRADALYTAGYVPPTCS